ncbi:MAG: nitrile hydratase accessory protein [Mycobacterium sp.]
MSATQEASQLDETRRRIEKLVCGLPGGDADALAFSEPWELRAFAIAVAAYHGGHYEWSEFQLSLIESIRNWEAGDTREPWNYYERWLDALENVLATKGKLADPLSLDDRARTVLATPRNANHHEAHREPVAISPALQRPPPA